MMQHEDYYDSLLTGTKQGRKIEIKKEVLEELINKGLSSVKIAKSLNISYVTVRNRVKSKFPDLLDKLNTNGKTHQIRRRA